MKKITRDQVEDALKVVLEWVATDITSDFEFIDRGIVADDDEETDLIFAIEYAIAALGGLGITDETWSQIEVAMEKRECLPLNKKEW